MSLTSGEDDAGGLPPLGQLQEGSGFVLGLYRRMLVDSARVFGELLTALA